MRELSRIGFNALVQGFTRSATRVGQATFLSPTEVLRRIQALDADYTNLNTQIAIQPDQAPWPSFKAEWNPAFAQWRDFASKHSNVLQIELGVPGAVALQVESFRVRLQAFQAQFVALQSMGGATPTTPGQPGQPLPTGPITAPTSPPEIIETRRRVPFRDEPLWLKVATIGAIGGLAYLGYRTYKRFRTAARIVRVTRDALYDDEDTPKMGEFTTVSVVRNRNQSSEDFDLTPYPMLPPPRGRQ